jgi:hypothetical protein
MNAAIDYTRDVIARWGDPDPKYIPLLKEGGITALLPERVDETFERALKEAGIKPLAPGAIKSAKAEEIEKLPSGAGVALRSGLWPGIARGGSATGNDETASASRQPWVDADSFWVRWLRAMFPQRAPLLGYLPDADAGVKPDRVVPFDSHELALIDARSAGGNYILALEARFRESLLKGDPKARAAWSDLGRTARWLAEHDNLFHNPVLPVVTLLVEGGEETAEIANLAYRRCVSPALERVDSPPPPDPSRRLAIVAANIKPPKPQIKARILAHAAAGASVIVAAAPENAWWKDPRLKLLKSQEDRDFFTFGKGQVVAYKDSIQDPSEFALDVIDIVTHRRRAVRIWNAPSVIAVATSADPRSGAQVILVNYGRAMDYEMQARVQGFYTKASLLRPEKPPLELKTFKRGSCTEVMVPELQKLGVLVFS